jgi:hypothetical protein
VIQGLDDERFLSLPHPEGRRIFSTLRPPITIAGCAACAGCRMKSARRSKKRRCKRDVHHATTRLEFRARALGRRATRRDLASTCVRISTACGMRNSSITILNGTTKN